MNAYDKYAIQYSSNKYLLSTLYKAAPWLYAIWCSYHTKKLNRNPSLKGFIVIHSLT